MADAPTIHDVRLAPFGDYTDFFRGEVFRLACEIRRHGEGWGWRVHGLGFVKQGWRCPSAEEAAKLAEDAITEIARNLNGLLRLADG